MVKEHCINEEIKDSFIQLVLSDGQNFGTLETSRALEKANEEGLDLVQLSPARDDKLSICKLMDYGKLRYKEAKKNKGSKKIVTKEIKFGINIAEHDLQTKHNHIFEFLSKKYMVKYSLILSGRDKKLKEVAYQKMLKNLCAFEGKATWEEIKINEGGSTMIMGVILVPVVK